MTLDDYREIWQSPIDRYVLVRIGKSDDDLVIYDPIKRAAELIDDDDAARGVIRRMIEIGFSIVDELPSQDT